MKIEAPIRKFTFPTAARAMAMHSARLHTHLCMTGIAIEHTSIATMRAFEAIAIKLVYIDVAARRPATC